MRLGAFLLRWHYCSECKDRPDYISPERWAAMVRWYNRRIELGEPFSWE